MVCIATDLCLLSRPGALVDSDLSTWKDLIHSGRLQADEWWLGLSLEQITFHVSVEICLCNECVKARANTLLTVPCGVPKEQHTNSALYVVVGAPLLLATEPFRSALFAKGSTRVVVPFGIKVHSEGSLLRFLAGTFWQAKLAQVDVQAHDEHGPRCDISTGGWDVVPVVILCKTLQVVSLHKEC